MSETLTLSHNDILCARAKKVIPGGVNSPVRACLSVDSDPIYLKSADGAYVYDMDSNPYLDYVGAFGPHVLGHRHPKTLEALEQSLRFGTSFGACTKTEVEMAEFIVKNVKSIEMIRMVNSGTEATMSSIRLARAFTGRNKIIKFEGCYHGHCDSLMVKAGSGLTTFGIATSQGIPQVLTELTFSLPFNELKPVIQVMKEQGNDIACIILEPIIGNSGVILPEIQFLQGLRALADEYKCLLIFDEVMTGFRVSLGGAQELYNIEPDLTCLGKIIGGGLPVGAYGGKKKIMEMLSPIGSVYQAGTLSGNPLAMAAGLAQLKVMTQDNAYQVLKGKTEKLVNGIKEIIKTNNYPITINHTTGMFSLFFHKNEIHSYEDALKCDTKKFTQFWKKIKELGLFWPPSQFEACFISLAHSDSDIKKTISIIETALNSIM